MFTCPTCDDDFETKAAMHAHHKRTHGESLPIDRLQKSTCIGCEHTFTFDPERRQGDICVYCAELFPGIHNSPTIRGVVENMDRQELRSKHPDDAEYL